MRTARGRTLLGGVAVWLLLAVLAPAFAAAGSISGTVTAAGGGSIEGIEVCARPEPYEFETECVATDVAGSYGLVDLPAADYRIRLSADEGNLRYISEYYDDTIYSYEADLFELEAGEDATVDAELAEGGSISGTVVDETTAEPIEGLWPCASAEWIVRCGPTNADGEYIINGLPTGTYKVEFWGANAVNYLTEWYDDSPTIGTSTAVEVTAPATTPGKDAELAPGAQILGRVTESGTGAPLEGELVCAEEPGFDGYEQAGCDLTDESGEYTIRGLPAGTYIVSFGLEYAPEFGSPVHGQWWQGASSREEAEPITIAPPETRAEINAVLPNPYSPPEPEPDPVLGSGSPDSAAVTPPALVLKKPLPRCKKGFHRKLVKGKKRCVRKHRRHRKPTHR